MTMHRYFLAAIAVGALLGTAAAQSPLTSLEVFPPDINLETARDRQSFIVQVWFADGLLCDVTDEAKVAIANAALIKREGNVHPATDGKTEMIVEWGGKSVKLPVTVKDAGLPIYDLVQARRDADLYVRWLQRRLMPRSAVGSEQRVAAGHALAVEEHDHLVVAELLDGVRAVSDSASASPRTDREESRPRTRGRRAGGPPCAPRAGSSARIRRDAPRRRPMTPARPRAPAGCPSAGRRVMLLDHEPAGVAGHRLIGRGLGCGGEVAAPAVLGERHVAERTADQRRRTVTAALRTVTLPATLRAVTTHATFLPRIDVVS